MQMPDTIRRNERSSAVAAQLTMQEVGMEIKEKMAAAGLSAEAVAKELGIGKSSVYAIINGSYTGKAEIAEKVLNFIEEKYAASEEAKNSAFLTQKQRVFLKGLEFCYDDSELLVICGPSGIGKTFSAKKFASDHPGVVYYKVKEGFGWKNTLSEIAALFNRNEHGSSSDMMKNILAAIKTSGCRMLIIDEIEHIFMDTRKNASLKRVAFFREIQEACGVGVALIGLDVLESELRFAAKSYITNRIDCLLKGEPVDLQEMREFWEKVLKKSYSRTLEPVFEKAKISGNLRILKKLAKRASGMSENFDAALYYVFS